MEAAGAALGVLAVVLLATSVVMLLVGALVLKFSVSLIEKFSPSYGRSLLAVLLAAIASFVVSVVLVLVFGLGAAGMAEGGDPTAAMSSMGMLPVLANLLSFAISFLVMAFAVNLLIKRPDGSELGFGHACLVSLLYMAVMVVLFVIIGIVLALVFGAAILGAAGLAG
jgi:hypothetical protein